MKAIILYKSKYGATKQYAEWLSGETGFPVESCDRFNVSKLGDYDMVILGSSVYIGKLLIHDWIQKYFHELKGKQLHLFLVSGTPSDQKEKLLGYIQSSVPKEILGEFSITYLHGKLLLKELSWLDKLAIKFASKVAEKQNPSERIMLEYNDVKRENLEPLVNQLKQTVLV